MRVSTVRANDASKVPSVRACAACWARRAARSTTRATRTATSTMATSVTTFSGSAIVKVYSGGVRKKLSSKPPASAGDAAPGRVRRPARRGRWRGRTARRRWTARRASCSSTPTRRSATAGSTTASTQPRILRICGRDRAARRGQAQPATGLVVGDHVHVDGPGVLHDPGADALDERPGEPGAPRGADDELGGVDPAGEVQQGAVGTSSSPTTVWKLAPTSSARRRSPATAPTGAPASPSPRSTCTANRSAAPERFGDPGGAAQHRLALRTAGEGDDDPLAGLPDVGDLLVRAVPLQGDLDLVGEPQQGQLPQRGEVARLEVVGQRRVDPLRGVHVAVGHPAAQRLGGDVDQLDLLGVAHHLVGHGLLLAHPGDPLDHVVERLEVLDVHRGEHVDPGLEQVLDVLPALGVPRARGVGVGELVDQHHLGAAGEHRVDVQLGRARRRGTTTVRRGTTSRPSTHLRGLGPAVGLDQPDDDVGAPLGAAVGLAEHGVGLADPGRRAEVDPQLAAPAHGSIIRAIGWSALRRRPRFSSVTLTRRLAEEAQDAPVGVPAATSSRTCASGRPVTRATRATCSVGVRGADVAGRRRSRRGHRVGRHGLGSATPSRAAIAAWRWSTWPSSFSDEPALVRAAGGRGVGRAEDVLRGGRRAGVEVRVGGRVGRDRVDPDQ